MAIRIWRGDADRTAQVVKVTPSSIESGDQFTLTINRKDITVTADEDGDMALQGTDTEVNLVADVVNAFVTAIGVYGNGTTTIPEFVELAARAADDNEDGKNDYLTLTGPTDGTPFTVTGTSTDAGSQSVTVTVIEDGDAGTNEKQVITIPGTATSGTFTLSFKGQTTGNIAYNASAATVETAFEALSSVGAGNGTVTGDAGGPWTVEFTGTLAATSQPLISADGSSLDGNHTYTVDTTTAGGGVNHIYDLGKYTATAPWVYYYQVRFRTAVATTDITIYTSDTVGAVQAKLDAALGTGQMIARTKTRTNPSGVILVMEFEWIGASAGTWAPSGGAAYMEVIAMYGNPNASDAYPSPLTDYSVVTEVQDGTASADEVQVLTILYGPTGGTFTLTFEGQTTSTIAYNASAATVETALEGLSTIDGCTVTGNAGGPYTITFDGSLVSGRDVEDITATLTALTGSAVYVAETQAAVESGNETQVVELSSNTTGGTFTLTWDPGGGDETTGNIAYDATAGTVQTALEGLATPTSGDFSVTGAAGGPWTVEFTGTYAATNVNTMSGDGTNLTGAGSQAISVSTTTSPTGPNWFSDANNWQTPGSATATAPTTGDIVVFEDNDTDCLYGLEDLAADTFSELHVRASFTGNIGLPNINANDYYEYRPTALKAGMTTVVIGEGDGNGSARVILDGSTVQSTVTVHATGQSDDETEKAFIWQGTHASNRLDVLRGDVGIGTENYSDACAVATLNVGYKDDEDSDVSLRIGVGITALGTVVQQGGIVHFDSPSGVTVTSWTKYGGELHFQGEAAITTLNELEGTTYYESSGTCTTMHIGSGGTVDCSRDMRAKTFTNVTMQAGSTFLDPSSVTTRTNDIILNKCDLDEVRLVIGVGKTIGVS